MQYCSNAVPSYKKTLQGLCQCNSNVKLLLALSLCVSEKLRRAIELFYLVHYAGKVLKLRSGSTWKLKV